MRRAFGKVVGREHGKENLGRFKELETIIVAAACVATAAICTYIIYSAL